MKTIYVVPITYTLETLVQERARIGAPIFATYQMAEACAHADHMRALKGIHYAVVSVSTEWTTKNAKPYMPLFEGRIAE